MVSPKNLELLRSSFNNFRTETAPDMFFYAEPIMEALFDINTIESYVVGITIRVIDGETISKEEILGIPNQILDDDGVSCLSINGDRPAVSLKDVDEVLSYAKKLDQVRCILIKCLLPA